jgi:glycosyltransferase involved in cell wall biosynthesis
MGAGAAETARRLLGGRSRAGAHSHGVNVVGYLDATGGLGERARELVATLRAGGVPVDEWSVQPGAEVAPPTHRRGRYDTTIAVVTAVQLADVSARVPEPFERARRTIGYFFWELAEVPDEQQWGIGLVDEIWAPTEFVAAAYRGATDTPVTLQPLPLPRPFRRTAVVGEPAMTPVVAEPAPLEVLVSLDLMSVMERKNPLGAIEAFRRAFPGGERARLTVKTLNGEQRPSQLARLRDAAADDDRIRLVHGRLDAAAHELLIANSDVLLSLHRSEGLGLHLAEAMSLGTLVIASRYGGNLDFMDDDCAALVDVRMIEVTDGEGAYAAPAQWADPDLDQAATFLRRAVADGVWRSRLTTSARKRIDASPSRGEIGASLARTL